MTPTTPASEQERETAYEREQADKITTDAADEYGDPYTEILRGRIAAALAQARERAEREQMEIDCGVLCFRCRRGDTPKLNKSGDAYVHYVVTAGREALCGATTIRAANAERERLSRE